MDDTASRAEQRRRQALSWPAAALPGLLLLGMLTGGAMTLSAEETPTGGDAPVMEFTIVER